MNKIKNKTVKNNISTSPRLTDGQVDDRATLDVQVSERKGSFVQVLLPAELHKELRIECIEKQCTLPTLIIKKLISTSLNERASA